MKVVLDTNILVLPFTKKIDIFSEIDKIVPKPRIVTLKLCLLELKQIKPSLYKSVTELLKKKRVLVSSFKDKNTDTALLKYCTKNRAILCTIDKVLKGKAFKEELSVISVRGKLLKLQQR